MVKQRDSLASSVVLNGRYEVKTSLNTTTVERCYKVYDRKDKKEKWMKEFYPISICNRGQDGQVVVVKGEENRRVYHSSKECFEHSYRQLAMHPICGLPAVEQIFSENNTTYIVLKKREGELLSEILRKSGGRMSYDKSLPMVISILGILEKTHKQKLFSLELSKDMIFIPKESKKKEKIILLSFAGARRSLYLEKQDDVFLKEGLDAPEWGQRNVREETLDIYNLGALWYEMLTGIKAEMTPLRKPSELGIDLPENVEETILRCLQKSPRERWQSVEEMLAYLPMEKKKHNSFQQKLMPLAFILIMGVISILVAGEIRKEVNFSVPKGEEAKEGEPFGVPIENETTIVERSITAASVSFDEQEVVTESGITVRGAEETPEETPKEMLWDNSDGELEEKSEDKTWEKSEQNPEKNQGKRRSKSQRNENLSEKPSSAQRRKSKKKSVKKKTSPQSDLFDMW